MNTTKLFFYSFNKAMTCNTRVIIVSVECNASRLSLWCKGTWRSYAQSLTTVDTSTLTVPWANSFKSRTTTDATMTFTRSTRSRFSAMSKSLNGPPRSVRAVEWQWAVDIVTVGARNIYLWSNLQTPELAAEKTTRAKNFARFQHETMRYTRLICIHFCSPRNCHLLEKLAGRRENTHMYIGYVAQFAPVNCLRLKYSCDSENSTHFKRRKRPHYMPMHRNQIINWRSANSHIHL